jgi:hypothetical protein
LGDRRIGVASASLEHGSAWEERLSPATWRTRVAGERLFVDYAGMTLEVIDGLTGK